MIIDFEYYMRTSLVETIVLIGLDEKMIQILGEYIGNRYRLLAVNKEFSIDRLDSYKDSINLFLIDTDQPFISIEGLMERLNSSADYQSIPKIGLALKKHFASMGSGEKRMFDDILLMPCGNEDLLTRIDIWQKTFEIISNGSQASKTYALDSLDPLK